MNRRLCYLRDYLKFIFLKGEKEVNPSLKYIGLSDKKSHWDTSKKLIKELGSSRFLSDFSYYTKVPYNMTLGLV